MSNQNIYEMLNDAAMDLSIYEQTPLNDIEKRKLKQTVLKSQASKGKKRKAAFAAAFLACCICTTAVYKDDVYAFVKELQYKLNLFIGAEALDSYIQTIQKTVSNKNVSVTLNEVLMDNDELIITTTLFVDNKEETVDYYLHPSEFLTIDGIRITGGASGAMMQTDHNTFESYTVYDLTGYSIDPEAAHVIDYSIKNIAYYTKSQEKEITGKWDFKFSAEKSQLLADTLNVPLAETILLPDGKAIHINAYASNVIGQKIYFDILEPGPLAYRVELRGVDDKGRAVVFYTSRTDQNGGMLKIETIDNGYIHEDAKTLFLTPYITEISKESGRMNSDYTPMAQEIIIPLK